MKPGVGEQLVKKINVKPIRPDYAGRFYFLRALQTIYRRFWEELREIHSRPQESRRELLEQWCKATRVKDAWLRSVIESTLHYWDTAEGSQALAFMPEKIWLDLDTEHVMPNLPSLSTFVFVLEPPGPGVYYNGRLLHDRREARDSAAADVLNVAVIRETLLKYGHTPGNEDNDIAPFALVK